MRNVTTILVTAGSLCFHATAEVFTISTPGGNIDIDVPHVAPAGSLVRPGSPQPLPFTPPSIFSAPLPSGSGARALGVGGAFTALADDATAASWNPAGLIQLEQPEVSLALRGSKSKNKHTSSSIAVGEESYEEEGLNYISGVLPFSWRGRNMVASLNLQETFDFTQQFSARFREQTERIERGRSSEVFEETRTEAFSDGVFSLDFTSQITTRKTSSYEQLLKSGLVSDLTYRQEGVIYALSPAVAVEVTPMFSLGAAVNFHMDSPWSKQGVRSHSRTTYSGRSVSQVRTRDMVETSGTYAYEGVVTLPPSDTIPFPLTFDIADSGVYPSFSDEAQGRRKDEVVTEGVYDEINEFDEFHGINATLGALWALTPRFSLGVTLETPLTADADQTKTVVSSSTTYNSDRTRVLDEAQSREVTTKKVQFEFPMMLTVGALFRCTESFYLMADIGRIYWSDFSFQAAGDEKINPLDGSPHGENPIQDTWSARIGMEYLLNADRYEVPLRCGFSWEERPALGQPDDYYSISLGSGLGLGRSPTKAFLDAAYVYTWSRNASGLLPSVEDLDVKTEEHLIMVSLVWHL